MIVAQVSVDPSAPHGFQVAGGLWGGGGAAAASCSHTNQSDLPMGIDEPGINGTVDGLDAAGVLAVAAQGASTNTPLVPAASVLSDPGDDVLGLDHSRTASEDPFPPLGTQLGNKGSLPQQGRTRTNQPGTRTDQNQPA